MAQLGWRTFLVAAIGQLFFQNGEGILRNPGTDQCLYLGFNPALSKDDISVYVHQCSWTDLKKGLPGNEDQWVEVVPITNAYPHHKIQKFNTDTLLCVNAKGSSIKIGDCRSSDSVFLFKPIRDSISSTEDSRALFTIEQPGGKCVTILENSHMLELRNCSSTNPLQRWEACRHINACDVEVTWSPSRIIFPNDSFNSTSDFEPQVPSNKGHTDAMMSDAKKLVVQTPTGSKGDKPKADNSLEVLDKAVASIIINEPLYFIYNSLKDMKRPEKELVEIVADFYDKEELKEALDILNTNRFSLDIDPRALSTKMSLQLVNRVRQVGFLGLSSNIIFASKNLSRVPLTPPLSAGNTNKPEGQPCPSLNALVGNKILQHLQIIEENVGSLKSALVNQVGQLGSRPGVVNGTGSSKIVEPLDKAGILGSEEEEEDISKTIDIRFGPIKKKVSKGIVSKLVM